MVIKSNDRFGLKHGNRFAYVFKHGGKFVVLPCRLHIVIGLQANPNICGYARCRLDFQCRICRYRAFPVYYLIKRSVRHANQSCKLPLRQSARFQLVFKHFAGMYRLGRLQLVRSVNSLCCFHARIYL